MPRERRLSRDELALWQSVARQAKPLHAERSSPAAKSEPAAKPAASHDASAPATLGRDHAVQQRYEPAPSSRREPTLHAVKQGRHHAPSGIDRRSFTRLKRGQMPIDARLDLHGMTLTVAYGAVVGLVGHARRRGQRCLLIITGKGFALAGTGALRRELPRWLETPPLSEQILAYTEAQPGHGGGGAFYVLLRRQRDTAG